MLSSEFLLGFKRKTEEKWREKSIDPRIYGYQFQTGTRWNSGLSDDCILNYENAVGIHFSSDFKAFLRAMNGTDLPTLNIYGSSGEPSREWVGVYAYPKDLKIVQHCIAEVEEDSDTLVTTLAEQGFTLTPTASLMPIYMHRYVVCESVKNCSVVLSIWDSKDAIVYGYSLQEYLEREFLGKKPSWVS
jgi:hypothetical protein